MSSVKICTTFVSGIHSHLTSIWLNYHLVPMNSTTPIEKKNESSSAGQPLDYGLIALYSFHNSELFLSRMHKSMGHFDYNL